MADRPEPFAYDREQHERAVTEWRRARLARLTAPDWWLSLVGRVPLPEGASSAGSDADCVIVLPPGRAARHAGTFGREGHIVSFTPAAGATVLLRSETDERPLPSGVAVRLGTDRDGPADRLVLGAITMEVTDRESGLFVRVRDPESPARQQFAGIEHYPVDPRWRVVARLERYEPPKTVDLGYEAGTTQQYTSPGAAVFTADGVTHRVEPVLDGDRPRLYLLFRDRTAGDTTYGAGRFLYSALPDGDRVVLDFNQAFSPPCAYTPHAACPIAPPQNRLAVRIEAGEKSPHDHGQSSAQSSAQRG
ncbi:MAG: DUF1684 domain-containing protein [Polyangiaceae bacterium]